MNQFKFYIPLTKNSNDFLTGIASTLAVDRDSEKMSPNALEDMQREIISNGVNLFGNHEHDWENTLGVIKEAKIENNELKIGIRLDDPITNPKVPALLNKLKRGIKLGLSVGGAVTKEKTEYDREQNKRVKVIDGVKLYEISIVGIPSNSESLLTIPQAIMKSAKTIVMEKAKDEVCPECDGTGDEDCSECLGEGTITCPKCRGSGVRGECWKCDGTGKVESERKEKSCPICFYKMKDSKCNVCFYKEVSPDEQEAFDESDKIMDEDNKIWEDLEIDSRTQLDENPKLFARYKERARSAFGGQRPDKKVIEILEDNNFHTLIEVMGW